MYKLFHPNLSETKVTVSTNKPNVLQLLTVAPEARIIIVADSLGGQASNVFLFGTTTSNKEVYIGYHTSSNYSNFINYDPETDTSNYSNVHVDSINKIASFKKDYIDLNANVTINGSVIPANNSDYDIGTPEHKWQDLILKGKNLHFSDALIQYDDASNELAFKYHNVIPEYTSNITVITSLTYITSNWTVTSNYSYQSNYEYIWSNENFDIFTVLDLNDIAGTFISCNLLDIISTFIDTTSNLVETSNFVDASNLYVSRSDIITEKYIPIKAKELTLQDDQGNFAFIRTSYDVIGANTYGTKILSYQYDNTLLSAVPLAQLSTTFVREDSSNLYFTEQRVRDVINETNNQTSSSVLSTSNDLIRLNAAATQGFIDRIDGISSNFTDRFVRTFTSNIQNNASIVKSNIDSTSNELLQSIVGTSNFIIKLIIDNDLNASNDIRKYLTLSSNDISKYIIDTNRDISNYIQINSNSITNLLKTTSNDIATYIRTSDSDTSNYISTTYKTLNDILVNTSNRIFSETSNAFSQTSLLIDYTSNTLTSNIKIELQSIRDDIIRSDSNASNYMDTTATAVKTNILNFVEDINMQIDAINIDRLQDGPNKKIIRDGVYNYDLTTCNLTTIGDVIPASNELYNLGSPEKQWRHVYLSGNTIYLGDAKISKKQSESGSGINGIAIQNKDNSYVDLVVSKLVIQDTDPTSATGLVEIKNVNNTITVQSTDPNKQTGGVIQETTDNMIEMPDASNLFYTFARADAIASASNLRVLDYIKSNSNAILNRIATLNANDIENGISNKFIVNGRLESDLDINGSLIISNLVVLGSNTIVNTTSYQTERLLISTAQLDGPALKVIQDGTKNIVEFYAVEDTNQMQKFVITNSGVVQLFNSGVVSGKGTDKLVVSGNIKFAGTINGVSDTQFGYISDLASNLQTQINEIRESASSQASSISQTLESQKDIAFEKIRAVISTSNHNNIDYIYGTSNTFTYNVDKMKANIDNFTSTLDTNISNALRHNISNIFDSRIQTFKTTFETRISTADTDIRAHITSTSNRLQDQVRSTSNVISQRITHIIANSWIASNDVLYYNAGNVGIGNTEPTQKLDVSGNIKFSGSINQITSNEFSYLLGTRSNIKDQLLSALSNTQTYAYRSSNTIFQNLVTSSNTINNNINTNRTAILSGINSSSNNYERYIASTSNNLAIPINSFLGNVSATNRQSPWIMPNKMENFLNNDTYYTEGSVAIGASTFVNAAENKLEVTGDMLITDGDLKRTVDGTVEYYQLERWSDCPDYDTTTTKYIYNTEKNSATGFVAIGVDTPDARLHVGAGSFNCNVAITYFDSSSATLNTTFASASSCNLPNISAIFNSSIWTKDSVAVTSDSRIKKNIEDIVDDGALQKILAIQPKTYDYIDPVKGTSNVYGFIAQQIKEVIPEAVSLRKDVIPNIFAVAQCNYNTIEFNSSFDTSVLQQFIGKYICIIDMAGNWDKYQLLSVNTANNTISINKSISTDKVFVYGTEVDDFHVLDKSYIYTLNVCATQLLSRDVDDIAKQVEYLEGLYGITSTTYLDHLDKIQ